MPPRTDKVPMTAELNQKLFDSHTNEDSYNTQFNTIYRIFELLNDNNSSKKVTYLSTCDIPVQRFIDCIKSVNNTGFQKSAVLALIKLATLENCGNLTADKDFLQLQADVIYNDNTARNNKKLANLEIISWEEIVNKSNQYIASITKPYIYESTQYMGLNKLILANMIINMPILRTEEYAYLLLEKDDTKDCNYIQRDNNPDKWELILNTQKSDIHLNRRLSLHRSVVDLILQYDDKLHKKIIDPPLRKDSKTKIREENMSYLYVFKSSKGKIPSTEILLSAIKELYGQEITIMKLRVLHATYFKNQPYTTVKMREKLAKDMGHLFSTHVRDYELR